MQHALVFRKVPINLNPKPRLRLDIVIGREKIIEYYRNVVIQKSGFAGLDEAQ